MTKNHDTELHFARWNATWHSRKTTSRRKTTGRRPRKSQIEITRKKIALKDFERWRGSESIAPRISSSYSHVTTLSTMLAEKPGWPGLVSLRHVIIRFAHELISGYSQKWS